MKTSIRIFSVVLLLCILASCFTACEIFGGGKTTTGGNQLPEWVDYVSQVKYNPNSNRVKQEVTLHQHIDGDTTHFNLQTAVDGSKILKARYLGVDTPESTGQIEKWGKKASAYTKEKLTNATSIIVESDTNKWNPDSTGSRYMVWVWYKTADSDSYRNLNLEILQNGLAIANNTGASRYGKSGVAAIDQAKAYQLNMFSGKPDPEFYYGDAVELTLSELRNNIEKYNGMKVAFEGVITREYSQTVYVEDYDSENDVYYGMAVYYGYNLNGQGLKILSVGNKVRIVGTVQYYEAGGTWQISGLSYRAMKPDDPSNIQLISEGHEPGYPMVDQQLFAYGKVTITNDEGEQTVPYAQLALNSSIRMENLVVVDIYTTNNEESSSKGAMTLTCSGNGVTISVRTVVLYDENGELITAKEYLGKTINVQGIVDYYSGSYQIKVFSPSDITIVK